MGRRPGLKTGRLFRFSLDCQTRLTLDTMAKPLTLSVNLCRRLIEAGSIVPMHEHRGKDLAMSRIPLLTVETAADDAKPRLAAAEKANGFLPNLLGLLANAPSALEAYLTLGGINAKAGLTLAERETVQITAAATHGCGFCVAGHTAIAI